VNGLALSYDLNGNLISGNNRTPVWTADNTIASVTTGGVTASFAYDGFGERLKKTASGVTSIYPFGDDYEVTNGVVTKYVAVDGLGVIAKRVGSGVSIDTFWLHTDRLGSIQAVTDLAQDIPLRRTFRPYGETIATSGSHVESRGWINQRNDAETGLTYLHARYYDPGLGIFLSPDPVNPGQPYTYGFGDPINSSDRSGLDPSSCPPGSSGMVFCSGGSGGGGGGGQGSDPLGFLLGGAEEAWNIIKKIGHFLGGWLGPNYTPPPPLTPEQLAAYLSDPNAVKSFLDSNDFSYAFGNINEGIAAYVAANTPVKQDPVPPPEPTGPTGPVGPSGPLESFVPVWGSGRDALNSFQSGEYGWGTFHGAMAVTDLALAKSFAKGIVRFSQPSIAAIFAHGEFENMAVREVAAGLRSGAISAGQVPIQIVFRNGTAYTMNNRSLAALRLAGKSPTIIQNVTGNPFFERQLTNRLAEAGTHLPAFPRIRRPRSRP